MSSLSSVPQDVYFEILARVPVKTALICKCVCKSWFHMIPSPSVYIEILARVPVKTALICKCVCKSWFHMISSPSFVKMHHDLTIQKNNPSLMYTGFDWVSKTCETYTIRYDAIAAPPGKDYTVRTEYPLVSSCWKDDVELLGCCNGLVYFRNHCRGLSFLWNPATKEYKVIPEPPQEDTKGCTCLHAFGYDRKIGDYKVIHIVYLSDNKDRRVVDVYTLGTNSWITNYTELDMVPVSRQNGVLVNGLLHWLGIKHGRKVIMSLDMSNERFKKVEPPKEASENSMITVEVSKGFLCVLVEFVKVRFEVWVMKEYGVRESWTKLYIITHDHVIRFRRPSCSKVMWSFGEVLLWEGFMRLLYDPKQQSARLLGDSINFSNLLVNYFESLVSVNSGIYTAMIGPPER